MSESKAIPLNKPAEDPLHEVLQRGAKELLAKAVEAELNALPKQSSALGVDGKKVVVRNGHLPAVRVQIGLGDIHVKVLKMLDRSGCGIKFNSELIAPYLRRRKAIKAFFPWLYLRRVSAGQMQTA